MRDIIVTLIVLGSLPLVLRKPFFGILVWTWLSLMNPHRLCWSFAYSMPFAAIVAVTVLGSLLINKHEEKRLPWVPISRTLAVFWVWMLITTFFAFNSVGAWSQWDKVWKIQLFVFVTMMMLTSKERINALVWVMTGSLGLYGVKGGIFTLATGGGYNVMGPAATFIGGNNEIGLALIMTVPLMRYLQLQADRRWLKLAMTGAMATTFVAILGTQSRGAFLGLSAMTLYLFMKSRNKAPLLLLLLLFVPFAFMFMPESWYERMATIQTYHEDASAQGRINAWWTAWYLALDRPIVGGGFETFRGWVFARYSPDPANVHDVHSIYFETLGEHGFVGLGLFLTLGILGLKTARSIVAQTKQDPRLFWMRDLASMIHVSLIGYAVAGAFLGLAYFDFYYTLLATLVGAQVVLHRYRTEGIPEEEPAVSAIPALGAVTPSGLRAPRPAVPRNRLVAFKEWYAKL